MPEAISDRQLEVLCRAAVDRYWTLNLRGRGYGAIRDRITPEILATYLASHPDFIKAWAGYSSDKRTTGWYFYLTDAGCEVGSINPDHLRVTFTDRARGCAEFILREAERLHCTFWPWRHPRWQHRPQGDS